MTQLSEALDTVIMALDRCAELTLHPDTRPEIAAEQFRLGQILFRAELILSILKLRPPQDKPEKPTLRLVK